MGDGAKRGIFGRSFFLRAYCTGTGGEGKGISAPLPSADRRLFIRREQKSFPDFLLPLILTQVVEKGKASYCVFGGETEGVQIRGNEIRMGAPKVRGREERGKENKTKKPKDL